MIGSSKSRRILAYGLNPVLLQTRKLVLEAAGLTVDSANDLGELAAHLSEAPDSYGLVVVCHTVPSDEVAWIRERVGERYPLYFVAPLVHPRDFIKAASQVLVQ